jgi:uncharacterized protein (TIGR03437 family)
MKICIALLLLGIAANAQSAGIISTFAGSGIAGFSGDGGPATEADLDRPVFVHADIAGNIYIADENNQRIRRITGGTINTVAGNGTKGFSGDGGPATAAALNGPNGVCSDANGNFYVNDTLNQRIRRVTAAGVISTFAGNGSQTTSGDGGQAAAAGIFLPIRCAFDRTGNMFIAEQGGHRIRRVAPNGVITTYAGAGRQGFAGDGSPATAALLNNPTSVAVDDDGNVYFSDQFNHRIRRVSPAGVITTVAGIGTAGFSGDAGQATAARLNFPGAIALDSSGSLYFTDGPNQRTRRITPDGVIQTIAGTGTAGFSGDEGSSFDAETNFAFGIAIDSPGNIYLADTLNQRIRVITGLASRAPPSFRAGDVVNAASFVPGLSPGALATLFGLNLTTANGIIVTNQVPWPGALTGTSVFVNNRAAPIYALVNQFGRHQINFLVPFELEGATSVQIAVDNNGARSAPVTVPVQPRQPGIFIIDGSNGAFLHANFQVVTASNPAAKGEALLLFLTGLGAVNPAVQSGNVAPAAEPFARTAVTPTISVGGRDAQVLFSGLAPGFIALYQVNFVVPGDAPAGSVDVVVNAGGSVSNTAKLQIRP